MIRSEYENRIICGDWMVLKELPNKIFHCVITSPPYWGQRDYGTEGQLGLEENPELHIQKLVEGFREVRRVLRDDGVLWLNYGDKYASAKSRYSQHEQTIRGKPQDNIFNGNKIDFYNTEYQDGDLLMLPARVALALQADGWILRDSIIWAKAVSFCDTYVGSCMPESVNGWRWERCRVKVKKGSVSRWGQIPKGMNTQHDIQYKDCPGCPKCEPNGGYVLRKGSWRCTKAHEYLFQFVKTNDYFCDAEAVKEEQSQSEAAISRYKYKPSKESGRTDGVSRPTNSGMNDYYIGTGRNLRNVWTINPRGYKEAHYATFPEALVEPCIKVSTSQKGVCPKCGAQWARVVDNKQIKRSRPNDRTDRHNQGDGVNSCGNTVAGVETTTLGWRPTCKCGIEETIPALVGDPFMGSGTTAVVAARLGRNYWGCDINPDYVKNHAEIRIRAAETGLKISEIQNGQKGLFETAPAAHERGKPAPAAMERSQ